MHEFSKHSETVDIGCIWKVGHRLIQESLDIMNSLHLATQLIRSEQINVWMCFKILLKFTFNI